MATRPIQFTGMEERHTPKSELLREEAQVGSATLYPTQKLQFEIEDYPQLNLAHPEETRAATWGRRLLITVSKEGSPGTSGPSDCSHVSPT